MIGEYYLSNVKIERTLYIKEEKGYTSPYSIYRKNYRLEKRQPPVRMKKSFATKTLHTKGGCHE
jgi:hypothetical protein